VSNRDIVTGIAWYRRDQWARLREVATDADRLEEAYEDWLAGAQKTIVQMTVSGAHVRRVDIELDELVRRCRHEGRPLDSAARAAFTAAFTAERLRSGFEPANSENG
jgi:hypothetical protein